LLNRRNFLVFGSMLGARQAFPLDLFKTSPERGSREADFASWVKPAIGTGGHGHTYPGATVPFGAVQLSPDTYNYGWDWCSGYYLTDSSIMGFSHTHLSGTGGADLLDILLVPRVGELKLAPGSREKPEEGYRSRFSHDTEVEEPGYYSVFLETPRIKAEMTATERIGFHRYTFPKSEESHFVIDLIHAMQDAKIADGKLMLVGNDMILGGRTVHCWAPTRQIYFAMQFSKPWISAELYSEGEKVPGTSQTGTKMQAAVHYNTSEAEALEVKVGISMVSAENALLNLKQEIPDWDFDEIKRKARKKWNQELGRISIQTADENRKIIFYTALYHMMCAPTLADDVNGEYRGMDQKVHKLSPNQHNFSTYSLWDTFRALHPSFTLWQPERVPLFVNNLISMAEESPGGMPIWPLMGSETFCMTGYHSASVMAEACTKKFPGINWERAYKVMRKRNMSDDYEGLGYYRELGYIPADKERESVSKLVEYLYGDWSCAHVAEVVGAHDEAQVQRARSRNYRNLFDPDKKFLRAKMSDRSWAPNFDPRSTGHVSSYRDYTESNAWQTTFGVQHDIKGYIELFGGREVFLKKLDALFEAEPGVSNENVPDMSGFVGQYVHGNEPSHHILYLYVYAGKPYKTQKLVRQVLDTLYHNDPDGLAGNEDCGQMSAWYVMSSLGLYAVDPVSATYVLTAPAVESARITVNNGKKLVIEVERKSPTDIYVQSVSLNGKMLDRMWVRHEEIADGGKLLFVLGDIPNEALGADEKAAPPSMTA
jgi:predicted alpha-1,2-mannosidase